MSRLIPAWQAKVADYSHDEYVYILTDELDAIGWPKFKLVNYLMPVDPIEQEKLRATRPS